MKISTLASMFDLSAVQANSTKDDVRLFADLAIRYDCKAVFALSSFLSYLNDYREENDGRFLIGGTVGFPSGGMTTAMKVQEAKAVLQLGVDEIDMMINVGYLLSGMDREVLDDIKAVKQTIASTPLKVIVECHYLDETLLKKAAEMIIAGGAQWIKTGTGWTPTGATLENVAAIKRIVGDAVKVKASGGVRNLNTVLKMADLGVSRFGIGASVQSIMEEAGHLESSPVFA